jgi:hypothetical protein
VGRRRGIARLWWASACVAITLFALAAPPSGMGRALETGVPPQLSEAESQAAARAGAERALAAFVPPAGAIASPVEPAGDGGGLSPVLPLPGSQVVQLTRWWVAPESPAQVVTSMATPAGSSVQFRSNPENPALMKGAAFYWPAVSGARGQLRLEVQVVPLSGGGTGVRALVQGFWLLPRPTSEAIPAGMRLLRLAVHPLRETSEGGVRTRQRPLAIDSRQRIERVVQLINSLPVAQEPKVPRPCPAPLRGVVLRLAFYEHPHSAPTAIVRDYVVACGGVALFLGGHEEPQLEGVAKLPEEISEAIGSRIDVGYTPVPDSRSPAPR